MYETASRRLRHLPKFQVGRVSGRFARATDFGGQCGAVSGAMQSDPMQMINQMMGGQMGRGQSGIGRIGPNLSNMNAAQMEFHQPATRRGFW